MKHNPFSLKRDFYTLISTNGLDAELTLYGDIVESRPIDWWTEEPIDGNFIVQDEFLADLETVKGCSSLHIRINSAGGDAGVSVLIHNRLRELAMNGMKLSCTVDGVAMSGGSLIMCACDNVQVYPSSIIMIHKCWSFFFGGYSADELREAAVRQDAIDRAQAGIYQKKTGLSETQIMHMMADTTYMTGRDAKEKGFADTILDGDVQIAASADGRALFVGGREMHLAPGLFAPDFVPTRKDEESNNDIGGENPEDIKDETEAAQAAASEQPGDPGSPAAQTAERREIMTLDELRVQNPELANQIDAERAAAVAEAENRARAAERERMRGIDEIAATVGNEALVNEARYGETACDAKELAYRAVQANAKKGAAFLAAMKNDATASGTNDVKPVTPPDDKPAAAKTEEEKMAEARAEKNRLLHPEQQ